MLRQVHPPPRAGQGTDPPARRRRGARPDALSLTADEARRVRAALDNTSRAYGGRAVLAEVMGMPIGTLERAAKRRGRPSGTFAIRLAKAAGIYVEAMLGGAVHDSGRCSACGARAGAGRVTERAS